MIFTSPAFVVFFALVFAVYWSVRGLAVRQSLLLLASVVFYGWWDYRFLSLIALVIGASYLGALGLSQRHLRRGTVLGVTVALLLGVLATFKYANFIFDSSRTALGLVGIDVAVRQFSVVLPIGISFFTFHGISYLVDVYRGKIPVERQFTKVALYILFFPQLVAGPIVRAAQFMPQLGREPVFDGDEILRGAKLALIGFLYKAALADSIAPYVDAIYGDLSAHSPGERLLATLGFYAQIYFDFAGYSIMAIGFSRMLGYRLPRNFNFPYGAASVTEFWRRWHISLSSWLRDYLYIPLGGNRRGEARQLGNIMLTMLLGGLWHGASWNFVLWGGMHGLALCVHKVYASWAPVTRLSAILKRSLSTAPLPWLTTQAFVLFCWVPFRARTMSDTVLVWKSFLLPQLRGIQSWDPTIACVILVPLAVDALLVSGRIPVPRVLWHGLFSGRPWRIAFALGLLLGIALVVTPLHVRNFIYFQF